MKLLAIVSIALLTLAALTGCATSSAPASAPTVAAVPAAAPIPPAAGSGVAGDYAGKWTSSDGSSGDVKLSLKQTANGKWDATMGVSYQGNTLPSTVDSVSVDQSKVEINYQLEVQGGKSTVTMKADVTGKTLTGDYAVVSSQGRVTTTGTWTASRSE